MKMEKSRNYVVFGVLALVVSLVAVSLAYAGFTQTLNINGTASIKTVNWNVHFANLANKTVTGTATWGTQPAIDGTTTRIGDYSVNFSTPGDTASFEFDVVDDGNFNAKWTSLTIKTPSCTTTDANFNCSNMISYTLTEKGSSTALTAADNSVLSANGGSKTYVLTLKYNNTDNDADLPKADVTIGDLDVAFVYTQDGNYVAP